jgi:hypothetical protein
MAAHSAIRYVDVADVERVLEIDDYCRTADIRIEGTESHLGSSFLAVGRCRAR